MNSYWTLIIIFCFNLRVCVAFSEVEDEITALKSNISRFISFTAVDDILDNEYFSKAVDVLSLIPNSDAKMVSSLVKSEMDSRDKKQIFNSLVQTIQGAISDINANMESTLEMEGFEYYFAFVQNSQIKINLYFQDAMRYILTPWQEESDFIETCNEFKSDFRHIQRAFEPAICQFNTDPDSVIRYAKETLEVIDRIFRRPYNKTEYQQHEIIKQNFLTDISKLDPQIAFKTVNTVQSDFVKLRNVKLSTIEDIILPPYAYREICLLKDLIEENNYDRKKTSKVVRWFLSKFFFLTIVNTACNSLTTNVEYKYEDKKDKILDMARQLQIKTNTILDDFFVKDKKNLDRFLHHHFGLHAVNETISPGHYGLYSHELKRKLSSLGRPGFKYQVILLEKKPYIREELKCDDEHCQAFLFYETRIIIRRYAEIITPTTFENQHEWFLGCKEEIEKVFKKYPGAHRTLDQFCDHISLKCQPPGAYKYFAFYGVYSSILNPHPLLSIDGIAPLKVLGDHGYIDARSTVFAIKTYNYKIIMWP